MELKKWLIHKLGGVTEGELVEVSKTAFVRGQAQIKLQFAVLPLPFTAEELAGRYYGTFITPAGFGGTFGEGNVPAPGPHGYEQRAYWASKEHLDSGRADLACHSPDKFDDPANSEALVPVIVTVLR